MHDEALEHAVASQNEIKGGEEHRDDYAEPVVAGSVSSDGQYMAIIEAEGQVRVFMAIPHHVGGLFGRGLPSATRGELCPQYLRSFAEM